jgi:hypothetical protein
MLSQNQAVRRFEAARHGRDKPGHDVEDAVVSLPKGWIAEVKRIHALQSHAKKRRCDLVKIRQ